MELKPCPFCGGAVKIRIGFGGITYLYCDCGAVVSFKGKESKGKATEAWNRRADNAPAHD